MKHFFLSGSIPDPRRDPRYMETADLTAIRESVSALATVVFKRGKIIFGGHPAISPLVLVVAQSLHAEGRVRVYQSEYFRDLIPPESTAFPDLMWTPRVRDSLEASLQLMRERMIADGPFEAAFFIGGMEGVETEFELFRRQWPAIPTYPIASTGAAAKMLLNEWGSRLPGVTANRQTELQNDVVYGALFERLLGPGSGEAR
jgi:hypothetical protein